MDTLNINKPSLTEALAQWEQQHRDGNTRSYEETKAMTVLDVATESAEHLWQNLLAKCTTPPTITPPAIGQPWPGQGGIYIGVLPAVGDRPAMHMVAAPEESEALTWGPYGVKVANADSRHDGRANTLALLAAGAGTHPAAAYCAALNIEGHADFHLPSQAELFIASLHASNPFNPKGWYWSSTQVDSTCAFAQDFALGGSNWHVKDGEFRVRAVRWIQL